MGSNMYRITFIHLFNYSLFWSNFLILSNSVMADHQVCHDHERSALLQFMQTFSLINSASLHPLARPKFASWKTQVGANADCCLWDGVECSNVTGYVIGLDLSSSFIHGSINSSSTLFSLAHLQRLDLANNNFNYSQIPSGIARLSRLTHLNLSGSTFAGEIPRELLELSRLVSLDLDINQDPQSEQGLLTIELSVFKSIPQNLTNLKVLNLGFVHINSTVPETFANMSSLTALSLHDCALYGDFPKHIFKLPNLEIVQLWSNEDLTGNYLPEFNQTSHLKVLALYSTGLAGSIPPSLANLTQLTELRLSTNFLTGQIPSWISELTQLKILELSHNELEGPIPSTFSTLKNLEFLALHQNNLSGTVEADVFLNLTKLAQLDLSSNKISFLTDNVTTNPIATLPKFTLLALGSCNLREFPDFLRFEEELRVLSLADNMIEHMPEWMWNRSNVGLEDTAVLPWPNLVILHLINNLLQGPPPIPPPNLAFYFISNNMLTGSIPPVFCSLNYLSVLDMSNNNMTGTIPSCFGNFGDSLTVMNLRGNGFHGIIPQACAKGSNLETLDLSQNQLEGQLPRSLGNCSKLQILDLGNNQIDDSFPFWLGSLLELQVLALSSNKLHGTLASAGFSLQFPKLRIFDVANNSFSGSLPYEYFQSWSGMKMELTDAEYMQLITTVRVSGLLWEGHYAYSIKLTNKGVKREYEKILTIFVAIDLSRNKFSGEIPESIGSLKGLQSLNLSYNELTGGIPPSIGNLSQLESLDLSQNKVSGEIPRQLAQLNFLSFLNVSYNNFSGVIPEGKQFNTFQNSSYEGNLALCGDPLSVKCGSTEEVPAPSTLGTGGDYYRFPSGYDWLVMFSGIGSGLVVGLIFGTNLSARNHEWFVEKFGKWPKKWQAISSFERGSRRPFNS